MDGKSSVACYLMALDKCYAALCEKFERCRSNFERQRRLARSGSSAPAKDGAGGACVGFPTILKCCEVGVCCIRISLNLLSPLDEDCQRPADSLPLHLQQQQDFHTSLPGESGLCCGLLSTVCNA